MIKKIKTNDLATYIVSSNKYLLTVHTDRTLKIWDY
jgi:hypothetical protein